MRNHKMKSWGGVAVIFILLTSAGVGCSKNDPSQFSLQDEHYQQILDRQKVGIEVEPEKQVDVTEEMDGDDFEKLGDAHFQQGQLQMAKGQYEKVLDIDPKRILARYKLAVIYLEKGNSQEAYDQFHQILDYDLNYALAYEGMGRALLKMEKDSEAEQEFQAAYFMIQNCGRRRII